MKRLQPDVDINNNYSLIAIKTIILVFLYLNFRASQVYNI